MVESERATVVDALRRALAVLMQLVNAQRTATLEVLSAEFEALFDAVPRNVSWL